MKWNYIVPFLRATDTNYVHKKSYMNLFCICTCTRDLFYIPLTGIDKLTLVLIKI